ncbi:hypothetical protein [Saccharibacillus alkalitolerans]|uniref:Lipoprotein n=1 Tax=Saccharibacillus alkalitolerans TaxID=2705290 RepID=A0ABX0F4D9_9BACL|nr:hypothetical protein [Saccharibacillus alkalitolerans]NGZ75238.1 hypothetical protein [Saccharibacillus alkalitolerans]
MYKRLIAVLAISILLGGCGREAENAAAPGPAAAPIRKEAAAAARDYEGEGEAWTAEYSMYVPEDGGKLRARLTARYEGDEPAPTGEVKYSYYGADIEAGSGGLVVKQVPDNGIYLLRDLTTTEYVPDQSGTVELLLIWNGGRRSETIRLKPAGEYF